MLEYDIPKDADNDGISDGWEEIQQTDWVLRYGSATLFSPSDDKEPKDPDGPGGIITSSALDSDISIDDLRPRESAGTITVTFVNDVASSALSITKSVVGADITITVELADNGTSITSSAQSVITALNTHADTKTLVFAAPVNGDGSGIVDVNAPKALSNNLPAQKTVGDSLTVQQEYRGFILGGGGFDGTGSFGHPGGHKRLSPVDRELLTEVDIMDKVIGVTGSPTLADVKEILNIASKGFSDATNGAGIRMYWLIDNKAARYKVFTNKFDQDSWEMGQRKDKMLRGEFVHLSIIEERKGETHLGGTSFTGSFLYMKNIKKEYTDHFATKNFNKLVAHVVAHELTHATVDTESKNGFDDEEHVVDPDPSDAPNGTKDHKYLMRPTLTPENVEIIVFSEATIGQIDLTNKQSVEQNIYPE